MTKSCLVCDRVHYGRGYCIKHYYTFKKYGDPLHEVEARDGNSTHPLYTTWQLMHRRCEKPDKKDAPFYKDRGITVCVRWHGYQGFKNFVNDMGERPNGTSLDRIDLDKGYSPENCRWATPHQQSANTRRNKRTGSNKVGVSFVKHRGTWDARIMVNRRVILLGTFHKITDAITAREKAERKYGIVY